MQKIRCDVCGFTENYMPKPQHKHDDLWIGRVPVNYWSLLHQLPDRQSIFLPLPYIAKYQPLIPFEIDKRLLDNDFTSTPLYASAQFPACDNQEIFIKDERYNPTKSFKDRGMITLVSEALSLGYKIVVIPSTGNAAISLGYFGNKAGIETLVFLPENTPPAKTSQITKNSKVIFDSNLVESYEHCFEFCNRHEDVYNGFPANNIPYMQGLKTISYEIFLQLGEVPDWIVTPVGSGGNIVAQYIGFKDLNDLGLTNKMPRFVAVQVSGADPITVGFQEKQLEKIVVLENLRESKAEAIASDTCLNHFKIMNIIKETGGTAISVTESEIDACLERRFEYSSCSIFPAIKKLRHKQEGKLGKVVLVATAANRK